MNYRMLLIMMLSLTGTFAFANDFQSGDANNDGNLTEDEYFDAADHAGLFSDWDVNNDDLIDENEFNNVGIDGDFDAWDIDDDSYLSDDEFYDGTYDWYDEDDNGYWTANEWDDAGDAGLFDV